MGRTVQVRQVAALDGEGVTLANGEHVYTFLNVYLTHIQDHIALENWQYGLSTEYIFYLLTHDIRVPGNDRGTICCGYFLDYDITMWLRDLTEDEKGILWRDGRVIWQAPTIGNYYYIKYIPHKMFFVGLYSPQMGINPDIFRWPLNYRCRLVYDVAGFQQQSFLRTIQEWGVADEQTQHVIDYMKQERSHFSTHDRIAISQYCQAECELLARYVQELDTTLQEESIKLRSWHGAGAIASHILHTYHVDTRIVDPAPLHPLQPLLSDAIMHAYYGGRVELFQQGKFGTMFDYDLHSAYPAACVDLPDLSTGLWYHITSDMLYDDSYYQDVAARYPYALWFCEWNLRQYVRSDHIFIGPFPFRHDYGVYYPFVGSGWVHGPEVMQARRYYGKDIRIVGGFVYVPHNPSARPMEFVQELAQRRIDLKIQGEEKRSRVYKFALNSIYGKLAQHEQVQQQRAPFQSYYAAGFVTSLTRAKLFRMAVSDQLHGGQDVIMMATDGLFCTTGRYDGLGNGLGQWEFAGKIEDCIVIQPGVWFTRDGSVNRTRGFSPKSLTYEQIAQEWDQHGSMGLLEYHETRFVGLGSSVARGDFSQYGRWVDHTRNVLFYPARKFARLTGPWGASQILMPYDMTGVESEPYVPVPPTDLHESNEYVSRLIAEIEHYDQPDWEDN